MAQAICVGHDDERIGWGLAAAAQIAQEFFEFSMHARQTSPGAEEVRGDLNPALLFEPR
jgi:hypothetical protein